METGFVKIRTSLDPSTVEPRGPLESRFVVDQVLLLDGVGLDLVSAVELSPKRAPGKVDDLLEFAVPKIHLPFELAIPDFYGFVDSAVLEVEFAPYPRVAQGE